MDLYAATKKAGSRTCGDEGKLVRSVLLQSVPLIWPSNKLVCGK